MKMNIEKFIESLKVEITEIESDISKVGNGVSESILRIAIRNRHDRIDELTEQYLKGDE